MYGGRKPLIEAKNLKTFLKRNDRKWVKTVTVHSSHGVTPYVFHPVHATMKEASISEVTKNPELFPPNSWIGQLFDFVGLGHLLWLGWGLGIMATCTCWASYWDVLNPCMQIRWTTYQSKGSSWGQQREKGYRQSRSTSGLSRKLFFSISRVSSTLATGSRGDGKVTLYVYFSGRPDLNHHDYIS